jgi:hypothetical protein
MKSVALPFRALVSGASSATGRFRAFRRAAILLGLLPIASAVAAQLTLNWDDNSSDETGFKIERSDNGAAFVEIATVGADVTSYVDTTIVGGVRYSYQVRASNAIGDSPYSNVATNAPTFVTQPVGQAATAFQTVTLTATANGVPAPTFQWMKGGSNLVNGGRVSGATTNTLVLTGVQVADAGTYTVAITNGIIPDAVSNDAILTVNAAAQTITFGSLSQVAYSPSGTVTLTATSNLGLPISYASSNLGVATVSGNTVTIVGAGTTTITASQAGDANNLAAADVPQLLTVTKATQIITFGGISSKAIGTDPSTFTLGATASSGLTVSYSSSNPSVATVSGNTVTLVGGGTTVITASQAGDSNYQAANDATQNLVVTAPQTITFGPLASVTFGSLPFTLTGTTSSGLPITYFSSSPSVASISGNILTITGVGSATITATQSGNSAFQGATNVQQTLVVNPTPAGFPLFTTQPTDQTTAIGGTVTFTAAASGTPTPTLKWQVSSDTGATWTDLSNTGPYSGVTTGTLTVTGATLGLSMNQYRCVATNTGGVGGSNAATLIVDVAPSFTLHPTDLAVTVGGTIAFTATASGTPTPTLQWQVSSNGGANWSDLTNTSPYSGVTTATLTITGATLGLSGNQYRCVATNIVGVTPSNAGTLTVSLTTVVPTFSGQPSNQAVSTGSTITFSATAGGVPTPTLQWQISTNGGANWTDLTNAGVYSGVTTTVLTLTNVSLSLNGNQYRAVATNTAGVATSNGALLTVSTSSPPPTGAPTISTQPVSQLATVGGSVTFSVVATGNPVPTYQWRRNGEIISGATDSTLTLTGVAMADSGAVFDVVVSNTAGSATSTAAVLSVTETTAASSVFVGDLGSGGKYSLFVDGNGQAILIASLPNGRGNFVVTFTVGADGTFHANTSVSADGKAAVAADLGTDALSVPVQAAATTTFSLSGTISNGQLLGQIDGTGDIFAGLAQMIAGGSLNAGYYEAPALNGATGTAYIIVAPSGTVTGAISNGGVVQFGTGTLAADGKFTLQLGSNVAFDASLDGTSGSLSGRLLDSKGTATGSFAGIVDGVTHTDRLVNISARGSSGDNEQIIITGFIVGGTQPRSILLRAVGPSLSSFGVSGVMENPVLTLFDSNRNPILTNDDWSTAANASLVSSETTRIGTFPLAAGSKDAVLLATLQPGLYTAQATRAANTANGVALIEIYDVSSTGSASERLVNISSRGQVRTGDGILIDGFVVSGNAPKKILIRGIGPSLASYGISNLLANPLLKLFQGNTMIASNDDWGSGDASTIATVSSQIGAFALPTNSKDSALLITLLPGLYTAQLSGADGGTGIGLLEVYEVP